MAAILVLQTWRRWIMVKILITGAYCVLNKGDAALRLGGLPSLKEHIPDAEFTIMTLFPEIDSKIYKGGRVITAIDSPVKAVNVVIRCGLWKLFHDYLGFNNIFVNIFNLLLLLLTLPIPLTYLFQ